MMATKPLKYSIEKVSSADDKHPANNILTSQHGLVWTTSGAPEQASVELKLDVPSKVTTIDVGNAGCASVDVFLQDGAAPHVRFTFAAPAAIKSLPWPASANTIEIVRLVCRPATSGQPYGLSFVRLDGPSGEDSASGKPTFGGFALRTRSAPAPRLFVKSLNSDDTASVPAVTPAKVASYTPFPTAPVPQPRSTPAPPSVEPVHKPLPPTTAPSKPGASSSKHSASSPPSKPFTKPDSQPRKRDDSDTDEDTDLQQRLRVQKRCREAGTDVSGLAPFLKGVHAFIHNVREASSAQRARRILLAYGATLENYMGEEVTHIVSDGPWDAAFENAASENPQAAFVRPSWLIASQAKQSRAPEANHTFRIAF